VAQDRPSRPPAITDVARAAGVSHQTVSRVLNQHPSVRPETRSRVLDAIADLGYRRNHAARALVTGRSEQLGVVVLGSLLFGPGSMLSAVEQLADQNGFVVSVASVHRDDPAEVARAVERLLDQSVAGLVLIVPVANAQGALDEIPPGVPYVVIDGDLTREDPLATVDQAHGAYLATRHLLDAGQAPADGGHPPGVALTVGPVRVTVAAANDPFDLTASPPVAPEPEPDPEPMADEHPAADASPLDERPGAPAEQIDAGTPPAASAAGPSRLVTGALLGGGTAVLLLVGASLWLFAQGSRPKAVTAVPAASRAVADRRATVAALLQRRGLDSRLALQGDARQARVSGLLAGASYWRTALRRASPLPLTFDPESRKP
jgi:hypothetical protein